MDPSSLLLDENDRTYGVHVSEPSFPLNTEGFTAFQEVMTGVVGTDPWDVSTYLQALAILRQLNAQSQ